MYNMAKLFQSVIPNKCLLCGQSTAAGESFCIHCHQALPYITRACSICAAVIDEPGICGQCLSNRPYFDSSVSVFEFMEPISSCIYKFKYQHQFYLGKILSLELSKALLSKNARLPDLIIPVPLHKKRLRQRGFNQSAMIARHVSKKLKIPCKNSYLARHKFSVPQIELNAKQRQMAVNNAFSISHDHRYSHIALIDDVVTTTHTVNQAAKALKSGGTESVSVWSIARNT